jgi:hypothetical protein
MLQTFLSNLRQISSNDKGFSRRRHPRRGSDRCVAVIFGQSFPVQDWSPGGICITADDRMFGMAQDVELTVKFRLRNTIIDIRHRAKVVRKSSERVAFQFEPLTQTIRRGFQQVIDDQLAREFANSQV